MSSRTATSVPAARALHLLDPVRRPAQNPRGWSTRRAVALAGLLAPLAAPATAVAAPVPPPTCEAPIPAWSSGRVVARVCPADAASHGLVVVDLGDDHLPRVLVPADGTPLGYAPVYRALAAERWDEVGRDAALAREDRFLELWGVFPSLGVLAARLGDEARHACHDAVDDAALAALDAALVRDDRTRRRLRDAPARRAAVAAVEGHLACDGLLPAARVDGRYDDATDRALAIYRRRHMRVTRGGVDAELRALLLDDSRALDWVAALRALRERVVDATGLIEDGSARGSWGTVLGRALDGAELRDLAGHPPMADGAPDLIAPATEAAARALGWTDPAATRARLAELRAAGTSRVALRLPPPPAYHGPAMALRAVIDRGDVWTARPFTAAGVPRHQPRERRPLLTLYARDADGRDVALVRWPTTIGGWQRERSSGGVVRWRYKPSPVGDFVWRDVIAAPAWFAPPTTPDDELLRRGPRGRVPREEAIGPGYRSAYGLSMIIQRTTDGGDTGIRAHGTANYRSVVTGEGSHGCHRLLSFRALRLTGFLLAHRPHVVRAEVEERYVRTVRAGPRRFVVRRTTRGYARDLDPPVPITVLEGRRMPAR